MKASFVNPFLTSLQNVLATMASTPLTPGEASNKKDDKAQGDISGLIGMVGPKLKGSLSITFEKELALTIMQRMLQERPKEVNEEVTDMVGEITNMVAGGAKKALADQGFEFGMATPVVVSGEDHTISHQVEGPKLMMPFASDAGMAYLEICFSKQT